MYGKIFESMYDGTLRVNWKALVTFQQMIVLCDADGVVDMTPHAISGRTGIPLDVIEEGIEFLEAPDAYSRTPDEDGRRIIRLDDHRPWGWQIVNHKKYKALQDADDVRAQNRERKRRQRDKLRQDRDGHEESRAVTECHAPSRHTDTDTDIPPLPPQGGDQGFEDFWTAYPRRTAKQAARKAWQKLKPGPELRAAIHAGLDRYRRTEQWQQDGGRYVPHAATWLNGRRWDDEVAPPRCRPGEKRWAEM